MTDDWAAVARAISDRLTEMRATQMEVAARARISLTTLRELQHNINPRRRRPQTLASLSEALGWPPDHLACVLHGDDVRAQDLGNKHATGEASAIEARLSSLARRIERIERHLKLDDRGA